MFLTTLLIAHAEPAAPPLIDIDGTILVQFGLFLVMVVVLNQFLFKPYLKMRAARDEGIVGARHKAQDMEARARKIIADYDDRMLRAKQRGAEERARLRSEAAVRERQLLGAARDESARALKESRGQVQAQAAQAEKSLKGEADALAREMASKILGREVA
ncbi:MAG: ATP synthase F0 subunit B [Polyangia bacterium]|jgi:F-type H+-transporting ATPase subunit b